MADLGGMGFKCNHLPSIFNSATPCEMSPAGPACISAWIFIFITLSLTRGWLLLSTLAELQSVSGLNIDEKYWEFFVIGYLNRQLEIKSGRKSGREMMR